METKALRLYGKNDLRLDTFDLGEPGDNEILAEILSNSICMSDHKAAAQGGDHKRVPDDVAENPIILGHEFCGRILKVGAAWKGVAEPGDKFTVQPALSIPGRELEAPGYSFRTIGGYATRVILPPEVMERNCFLPYRGDAYFKASLSEPVSCILGAFHTSYHYTQGVYEHTMGIRENGAMALLAGAGPMGLGAIDLAVNGPRRPRLLAVTDIDRARLEAAAAILSPARAKRRGVSLHYLNTAEPRERERLHALSETGYDDVMVFAPAPALLEEASSLLGFNGCLNFFAGPPRADFTAKINFYDVHYMGHHVVGSSGGNTDDMREALTLMADGALDPSMMITHVGGLDSAAETILHLPEIPGGKKLVYPHLSMPMTAIADFGKLGAESSLFRELDALCRDHNGLWSPEAETHLLEKAPRIDE